MFHNSCPDLKIVSFSVFFALKSSHSSLGLQMVANTFPLVACDNSACHENSEKSKNHLSNCHEKLMDINC